MKTQRARGGPIRSSDVMALDTRRLHRCERGYLNTVNAKRRKREIKKKKERGKAKKGKAKKRKEKRKNNNNEETTNSLCVIRSHTTRCSLGADMTLTSFIMSECSWETLHLESATRVYDCRARPPRDWLFSALGTAGDSNTEQLNRDNSRQYR